MDKYFYQIQNHSYILILALVLSGFMSFAQSDTLCGKVYAFKNLELIDILVTAKKTGNIVFTNSEGMFRIACSKNEKLVFSGEGFEKLKKLNSALKYYSNYNCNPPYLVHANRFSYNKRLKREQDFMRDSNRNCSHSESYSINISNSPYSLAIKWRIL